jgi:small subunit ribosomal protein S15
VCSNSYKNLENIDLSKVANWAKHENDTGSSEYQIARLTARIEQLSTHLQKNKKDFAAKRGLQAVLSHRKNMLEYLYRTDRER